MKLVSKKKLEPVPSAPQNRRWWRRRYTAYVLLLLAAAVVRLCWRSDPEIPRPDLRDADAGVVKALDEAVEWVRQSPRNPQPWGALGVLLLAHAFRPEAEQCFQHAAALDQQDWQWPYLQAVSQKSEQPAKAVESLRLAVARDSRAELPKLLSGEILLALGRDREAEAHFRQILSASPKHARASLGLARILYARAQYDSALNALTPALSHTSTRKGAHQCKAQILRRQGDSQGAAVALTRAQQLAADLPWPGDPESAIEMLRIDRQGYISRASTLQQAGDVANANEVAEKGMQKYPELAFLIEGNMRLEKGDLEGAERALQEALIHKPDWLEALYSLGRVREKQRKNDEAVAMFHQILKIEPSYGPAYFQLGLCLARESPQQAREALQRAVEYMPQSAEAHLELGNLLSAEGLTTDAERHFEHARRLKHDLRQAGKLTE